MRSMTGFGAGSAPLGSGRVAMEIRALNHKHQEIRVRLPAEVHEHGFYLEQLARERLGRGRFDVAVRLEGNLVPQPTINEERLRTLYKSLQKLAREFDPDAVVDIGQLLSLPDMLKVTGPEPELVREALRLAMLDTQLTLDGMQQVEGQTLKNDLITRLSHVSTLVDQITEGASELVQLRRDKLRERLDQLLVDTTAVPPERLEHEIALLADRCDITEELVRLQSHLGQFRDLLEDSAEIGRRLDFLLQEMSREVNTIGSKSPHIRVAQLVVEMKSEVERLREQAHNVA